MTYGIVTTATTRGRPLPSRFRIVLRRSARASMRGGIFGAGCCGGSFCRVKRTRSPSALEGGARGAERARDVRIYVQRYAQSQVIRIRELEAGRIQADEVAVVAVAVAQLR